MPVTTALFVIASLSLIGVPGTAGFVSKWYLGVGAIEAGRWYLVIAIMLGSFLSVIYMGRVIEV
ncbi:MAG: proton-conducting transporter membrane subunit, partial [Pseudomonadota bacterium]